MKRLQRSLIPSNGHQRWDGANFKDFNVAVEEYLAFQMIVAQIERTELGGLEKIPQMKCCVFVYQWNLGVLVHTPMPMALNSPSSRSAILTSSSAMARRILLDLSARWASRLTSPAATRSKAAAWT